MAIVRPAMRGVLSRRAVGDAFSPDDIAGLVTWFDVSDLDTLFSDTSGTTPASVDGSVWRMNDKKLTNDVASATSGNQPTLRLTGGRYFLEFDGSSDRLSKSSPDLPGGADVRTVFVVQKYNSGSFGFGLGWGLGVGSSNGTLFAPNVTGSERSVGFIGHRWGVAIGTSAVMVITAVVPFGASSTSDTHVYSNTTRLTETSVAGSPQTLNTSLGRLALGADTVLGSFFGLNFYESLVYEAELTTVQIGQVQDYLIAKWNI